MGCTLLNQLLRSRGIIMKVLDPNTRRMVETGNINAKYGSEWKNGTHINRLIPPECNYCEKKFTDMGKIRHHLRLHIGIRPYQCKMCIYRHWFKSQMMSTHYVNHGRKGVLTDIITHEAEEKRLLEKIEEDVAYIRENQELIYRGDKPMDKKIAGRENGEIYQEYRYVEVKDESGMLQHQRENEGQKQVHNNQINGTYNKNNSYS